MGIKKEDEKRRAKEVEKIEVPDEEVEEYEMPDEDEEEFEVPDEAVHEDDKKAYLAELEARLDAFPSYEDWLEKEGKKNKLLMEDSALARDTYEVYRDLAVISGSIFETPETPGVLDFLTYMSSSFSAGNISSYKDFKNSTEEVRNNILASYYHDASDLFDEEEEDDVVFAEDAEKEDKESEQKESAASTSKVGGDIIGFTIRDNTNVFVITDKNIADTVVKSIIGK